MLKRFGCLLLAGVVIMTSYQPGFASGDTETVPESVVESVSESVEESDASELMETETDVLETVLAYTEQPSSIEAFVTRFYVYILDRQPDEAGLKAWSDNLNTGKEAGANVGYGFIQSSEFLKRNLSNEDYVRILYRAFFDREADASGLNGWVNVLNSGMSRLHVYKGFAESTEFTDVCRRYGIERGNIVLTDPMEQNEGVTKFVSRCYALCLGRNADSEGLNAWCSQILSGSNNAKEVAYGFVFSEEFKNAGLSDVDYVRVLYKVFLDREADDEGLRAWVDALNLGRSRNHVFNGFANSEEFRLLCVSYGIDSGENTPLNPMYESYRNVVQEYEECDGVAGVNEIMDSLSTMTSLCFVKLVDFNNDGVEELLLVDYSGGVYGSYTAMIWEYKDNKAKCVYADEICSGGDIGARWIEFSDHDGQTYILSGHDGGALDMKYCGYKDGKFQPVRKFTSCDDSKYTINDKIVDKDTWEHEYNQWNNKNVVYNLRGFSSDLSFADMVFQITTETKIKLGL